MIVINGYFRGQSVTGQQRYATEIADRMLRSLPGALEIRPSATTSRGRQWGALQWSGPWSSRHGTLVSLTARTPLWARRHVVTIHDLFPLTNPEWFSKQYATVHQALLRWHLRHADAIVVVSEPVGQQVAEMARPGMQVVVAPNASTPTLSAGGHTSDLAASLPERFFLTVGSLEPRKNLPRLLEAHERLVREEKLDIPLLVAGGSADIYAADPRLSRVSRSVKFLGRVTDAELADLYARCAAFVSVSLGEGFGLPVVEALAATDAPLVLSDIPVYRWVMDDEVAQYVEPGSVDSIADGLLAAITRGDQASPRRRSKFEQRFSWERSAGMIAELATAVEERSVSFGRSS